MSKSRNTGSGHVQDNAKHLPWCAAVPLVLNMIFPVLLPRWADQLTPDTTALQDQVCKPGTEGREPSKLCSYGSGIGVSDGKHLHDIPTK